MTKEQLAAIEARANAATEGPWYFVYAGSSDWSVLKKTDDDEFCVADLHRHRKVACPDAEFIAHARTDVPALVAEVRRLRKAMSRASVCVDAAIPDVKRQNAELARLRDLVREAYREGWHTAAQRADLDEYDEDTEYAMLEADEYAHSHVLVRYLSGQSIPMTEANP